MKDLQKAVELAGGAIGRNRIVPVLSVPSVEAGLKICETLCANGLPLAEITFRTAAAAETIKEAVRRFPEMTVGAGTVINTDDLQRAVDAGAKFAVAPGTNRRILEAAARHGLPFFPGVATASEIETSLECGCRMLKFFPAEPLGGLKMLKSLAAPYRHLGVKFIPLGGVKLENMAAYLACPDVLAIGGSWLAGKEVLEKKDWALLSENIKLALSRR